MTKDEIITKLSELGIIDCIDNTYILTEKYKDVETVIITENEENLSAYKKLLRENKLPSSNWDKTVSESSGVNRAIAVMNLCDIPTYSSSGYLLKSMPREAIIVLNNIVNTSNIKPNIFIDAITAYYKNIERPKAFKNLLLEGDVMDIYAEAVKGKLTPDNTNFDKKNNTWDTKD